jgi:hypothetical protein
MATPDVKESLEMYVSGLRDGIVLFDAIRERYEGVKKKFCTTGRNLDVKGTLGIIDAELASPSNGVPYSDDVPIAIILIKALERFAPCT